MQKEREIEDANILGGRIDIHEERWISWNAETLIQSDSNAEIEIVARARARPIILIGSGDSNFENRFL